MPLQALFARQKDRVGGLLLVVIGLAVLVAGLDYRMGTLTRMGAGFVPVVLGGLLAAVGVAIAATAARPSLAEGSGLPAVPGHAPFRAEWRGWLCILGGVMAFVVLGSHGGLVPATFACVFIAALGDRGNSARDAALLGLLMVLAAIVVFRWALRLQLPLFAWAT